MRLHERTLPVQQARVDLERAVWDWIKERGLTYVEVVRCLLDVTQVMTKHQLREERHPGADHMGADEACADDCRHDDDGSPA